MILSLQLIKVALFIPVGYDPQEIPIIIEGFENSRVDYDIIPSHPDTSVLHDNPRLAPKVKPIESIIPEAYDALILPGFKESQNNDHTYLIKMNELIGKFHEQKKIIAAIAQGVRSLSVSVSLNKKIVTSPDIYKDELIRSGAYWINEPVVEDNGLITAHSVEDIEAFVDRIIEVFWKSKAIKEFQEKQQINKPIFLN